MAAKDAKRGTVSRVAGSVRRRPRPAALVVSAEERRRLIECCAYFRAAQFRAVEPGRYRRSDLRRAAAEIDAAIGKRAGRRGRP